MSKVRSLGVLMCYNDGDILGDAIEHLLENNHDVVIWNHGSTDETPDVLARYRNHLREVTDIGRDVDFYDMYPLLSKHLQQRYVAQYDWISWPDQDELLEGPDRSKTYAAFIEEAHQSPCNWIRFNDFVFWFTRGDQAAVESPVARVRRYSLARIGPGKIRSWRASATNVRWFNHNPTKGDGFPRNFNLRHYPMRSASQMQRRVRVDRAGLRRGHLNCHYENMDRLASLEVLPEQLHYDDGLSELSHEPIFDWEAIYGRPPSLPPSVVLAFDLTSSRWQLAGSLTTALKQCWVARSNGPDTKRRLQAWMRTLESRPALPAMVAATSDRTVVATAELAERWDTAAADADDAVEPGSSAATTIAGVAIRIRVDPSRRRVIVEGPPDVSRLLAFVHLGGGLPPTLGSLPQAHFEATVDGRYLIAVEPASVARGAHPAADATADRPAPETR